MFEKSEEHMGADKKQRLLGIDLCRGLAAYAVILVHSGDETWGLPMGEWAAKVRALFYFAVPFFLAGSFYFIARKPSIDISLRFWLSKVQRILVPYVIWSIIYLITKTALFSISQQSTKLDELLQDPISIVFFGGASYHLYFLPLLFTGSFSLIFGKYLVNQQVKTSQLILLTVSSLIVYEFMLSSGNSFHLGPDVAFQGLLKFIQPEGALYQAIRVILVQIAWIIRCLPYLLTALLLNRFLSQREQARDISKYTAAVFFFIFLVSNILGKLILLGAFNELLTAYSFLLFGIHLSRTVKQGALIKNLGLCSFGIYLIHPLIMNIIKIVLNKSFPLLATQISVASMLSYSILTFLLSWLTISLLVKNKIFSKYLFSI